MVEALAGADVYLGLSGGSVAEEAIAAMAPGCIVFSLANPTPEVDPQMAAKYAPWWPPAAATWPTRSTTCWPSPASSAGHRRGATAITEGMKLAAATAIADVVGDEVRPDYIVPSPLDRKATGGRGRRGGGGRRRARAEGVVRT